MTEPATFPHIPPVTEHLSRIGAMYATTPKESPTMADLTYYDPDELGIVAPTLDEADDEETVMADHSGGEIEYDDPGERECDRQQKRDLADWDDTVGEEW